MATFDFVSGEDFRESLETDYDELSLCMQAGAWKAVHVLAGSIIEAVLVDYLVASNYQENDPLKMTLGQVIAIRYEEGIISKKTKELSSAVNAYRNLIHPGRTVRLGERVDENGARIAQALVEIIIEQIADRKQATYGYTAEQIVAKLERDPSVVAILSHLLKDVNQIEMRRLLLEELPARYFDLETKYEIFSGDAEPPPLKPFEEGFRLAFNIAPEEIKREVAKRFVLILKEEGRYKVFTYGTTFFRASDIRYLNSQETLLVKEHLLSRLEERVDEALLTAMEGLGEFLTSDEMPKLIDPIVREIQISGADHAPTRSAIDLVENESWKMQEDARERLKARLDQWIEHFENRNEYAFAQTVQDIKTAIVKASEIPF